ncbi:hypothetical protein M0R45_000123 [Rubus argutus]|uniref:Uncharacterized protein n=1 Tax=Rubus argutus TaxID=59490 RepID=A0AAW1VQ69_RUBAR
MMVRMRRSSEMETKPVASLSRTLKASRSWDEGIRLHVMSSRKRGKSKGEVSFSLVTMGLSCHRVTALGSPIPRGRSCRRGRCRTG